MNQLSSLHILSVVLVYFSVLILISYLTTRKTSAQTFFNADKSSPWLLVAIGMIGASLSGATFISLPGVVGAGKTNMAFSYMQMVFGFLLGYFIIATVLMPIYYKYKLVTIYGYLERRFGVNSYKTGALFFILSRIIGASFRIYLVAMVLHLFITGPMDISFAVVVGMILLMILLYTYQGGIKTIVWTDTLQTVCMLLAVVLTLGYILSNLGIAWGDIATQIESHGYSKMFFIKDGWADPNNFFKQFISGALMALVMTGLDQDMMQKNLTCRNLKDAQKNVFVFSGILIFANLLFLAMGALLYIYATTKGIEIPTKTDQLYPIIALKHMSPFIGIVFLIGLIAAAFSSADSALTSLTTSFCVDFLDFEKSKNPQENKNKTRNIVHITFAVILFIVVVIFNSLDDTAIINKLFTWSGYTYGPILGLFAFAILTTRKINDKYVIPIAIASPIISFVINNNADSLLSGFQFGFLIVALNGLITFIGLTLISSPKED